MYTRHAIENLYPSKMGRAPGHTSNHDHLNLPPKFVNNIIDKNNIKTQCTYSSYHTNRVQHDSGNLRIITEDNIVVTVMRVKNEKESSK